MKPFRVVLLSVLLLVLLSACAAGANPEAGAAGGGGEVAGFWLGLWQGFITPVTFVVSLFTDAVNIYEVHNSGNWYDTGFVLGVSMVLGGGGGASTRGRR